MITNAGKRLQKVLCALGCLCAVLLVGAHYSRTQEARAPMVRRIEEAGRDRSGNRLLLPRAMTEKIEMGLVTLEKGAKNRFALHPDEEEGYLVLKGRGILQLGDRKHPIEAGMVAYVPRNTAHQVECTSDEPLEYVYFACWP